MIEPHKRIGQMGEALALKFLLRKGFEFVEKNYHAPGGEIDLIVLEKTNSGESIYHLVEVKTRLNNKFGYGEESITTQKINKILKAASHYFFKTKKYAELPEIQIDAIIVERKDKLLTCNYLENIGGDF